MLWLYVIVIFIAILTRPELLEPLRIRANLIYYIFLPTIISYVLCEVALGTRVLKAVEIREGQAHDLTYRGSGRFLSEVSPTEYRVGPFGISQSKSRRDS